MGHYIFKNTFFTALIICKIVQNIDFKNHLKFDYFQTNNKKVIEENRNFVNCNFNYVEWGTINSKILLLRHW